MADTKVQIPVKAVDELLARLIAVRGGLNDFSGDHPVIYSGIPAALDFVERICKVFRGYLLSQGSGPLQQLLITEVGERLHATDIGRHFTRQNFEAQIKRWNGYQAHLVSPEMAIRGIISDAFADVAPIAEWMMQATREFMSQAAKQACEEVAKDDPQGRLELARTIESLMEEVFDAWMTEAKAMSSIVMDMEKEYVSPVYWRRLTAMRLKASAMGGLDADQTMMQKGYAGMKSMRGKVGNLFGKFGRKGGDKGAAAAPAAPPGTLRLKAPKPPPEEELEDEDETPARVSGGGVDERARLIALRGLVQLQEWSVGRRAVTSPSGDKSIFLVGKLRKRSHKTRMLVSAWSERWFAYNETIGELYYWRRQPDMENIENPSSIMPLHDANILDASFEEMSGLTTVVERNQILGLRIETKVKNKHEELIVAFETLKEKEVFKRIMKEAPSTRPVNASSRGEKSKDTSRKRKEEEEEEEEERDPYVPHDEDEEKGTPVGSGELDDAGSYEEAPELPETPTGYQKGGLGMGSKYFCADDIVDAEGKLPVIAGKIVPPSRSRGLGGKDATGPVIHDSIGAPETIEWLAADASMYVTIVSDSISAAMPKVAVMSLVERAVNRELLAMLQEKLLQMNHKSLVMLAGESAMTVSPAEAVSTALSDIEDAMVDVRMAAHNATALTSLEPKDPKAKQGEPMCEVSALSLALANFSRRLSAANQDSPESIVASRYGPLFPLKTLEAADAAARRRELALIGYDRTQVQHIPDPLALPGHAGMGGHMPHTDEADGLRKESRGITSHFASMVEISKNAMGLGNRKRVTDADVQEEHRQMAVAKHAAAAQQAQQPQRGFRGSAAAPEAPPAAPAAAARRAAAGPTSFDPLAPSTAARDPLAPASYDPLAPRPATNSAPATSRNTPAAVSSESDPDSPDAAAAAANTTTTRLTSSNSNPNLRSQLPPNIARAAPPRSSCPPSAPPCTRRTGDAARAPRARDRRGFKASADRPVAARAAAERGRRRRGGARRGRARTPRDRCSALGGSAPSGCADAAQRRRQRRRQSSVVDASDRACNAPSRWGPHVLHCLHDYALFRHPPRASRAHGSTSLPRTAALPAVLAVQSGRSMIAQTSHECQFGSSPRVQASTSAQPS